MTSWQQRTEQFFGPDEMERLLPATHATIGRLKTDVMQERLLVINPALTLLTLPVYLTEDDVPSLLDTPYDFVVDAIDTIAPKF